MDSRDTDELEYPSLVHPLLASSNPSRSDASIPNSHWQMSQHSPPNSSASSSSQSSAMFAIAARPDDPHPQPTFIHAGSYHQSQHSPTTSYEHERHVSALDSPQVNGSIGPIRPQTQRGHRGSRPSLRWDGASGLGGESPSIRAVQAGDYINTNHSRPHTPNNFSRNYQHPLSQHARVTGSESMPAAWPSTPVSSHIPNYYYNHNHTHSRSDSTSTSNPRSASPALSVASVMTSQSSAGSAPNSQTFSTFPQPPTAAVMSPIIARQKHRKQRLFNVDRRAICVFANENPHLRQEDIAAQYGVERSTISKILKQKARWLNVPADEELKVAKHRPTKFPEIEMELRDWLFDCKEANIQLTDALIRTKAREIARSMQIPDDKFKASSGWVENFKHRHGIRKGIWHGNGRDLALARALGITGGHTHVDMDHRPPVDEAAEAELLRRAQENDLHAAAANTSTESMDYQVESEDSPEPVTRPAEGHLLPQPQQQQQSPTTMPPVWQTPSRQFPSPPAPPMQGPMPLEQAQPTPEAPAHYTPPAPLPPHHHVVPEPPVPQPMLPPAPPPPSAYSLYQNAVQSLSPPSQLPSVPPLSEAHTAMTTVLKWVDTQGSTLVSPEQRQTLLFVMRVMDAKAAIPAYNGD